MKFKEFFKESAESQIDSNDLNVIDEGPLLKIREENNDEFFDICEKQLDIFYNQLEIINNNIATLKNFLNSRTLNSDKLKLSEAICFVLKKERKELHVKDIFDKVIKCNLRRPYIDRKDIAPILCYLKKRNKIRHGKKRGYWRSV